MKNKLFFIAALNSLCFVHKDEGGSIVTGGISARVDVAKSNVNRQRISKEDFNSLLPIEIDQPDLSGYNFLERVDILDGGDKFYFRVKPNTDLFIGFARGERLPDESVAAQ